MLGGLDRVGAHTLDVDALDLGVLRQHRLQPGHAHLDCLLHHVVEALVLERCKQVVQVLRLGLRPGLFLQDQDGAFAIGERRLPFTIFAIERQNPVASLEAQHVAKIMRLRFLEGDLSLRPSARQ